MGSLTELRPVPLPTVYGFLRGTLCDSPARHAALRKALSVYCQDRELALTDVFTDDSGDAAGAAFTTLLDALSDSGGYGVVLPSPAHLGPAHQADARRARIVRTGAHILTLRSPAPAAVSSGRPPSHAGAQAPKILSGARDRATEAVPCPLW
ncbi:hypothetical protein [Streptomyces sp. CAU 1734]|uniref:hypothetical protein n=1 Tax=Streptomyces sp. CAU 1734 TaxID=3140360 RepID=UPI00326044BF